MNHKFDIQTDESKTKLFNYLNGYSLPSYVKEAELESDTKSVNFADSHNKLFAIDSPKDVFLSNAYFQNNKAKFAQVYAHRYTKRVESELEKAAELFNIKADLEKYNQELKNESYNEVKVKHASTLTIGDDEYDVCAYHDGKSLTKAAVEFVKNIDKYPFAFRKKVSEDIVKAAEEVHPEELPDLVLKYAGQFFPDFDNLDFELKRRSYKVKSAEAKETFDTLRKEINNLNTVDDIFKVAEIVYLTEKQDGLYDIPKIASVLGDVVDKLFVFSPVKVASMLDVVECHDRVYHIKDLQKIGASIYKDATGIELDPKCAEELREIFPTIPRADLNLLEELSGLKSLR